MVGVSTADFLQQGLGFGEVDSAKVAKALEKGCFLLGLIGGGGIALAGLSDLGKAGQGYGTSRSQSFWMLLAGLGVGVATVGGMCKVISLRITSFLDKFSSTSEAIGALTPSKRGELREEAMKLLSLANKIDEMYETEKSTDRFKLSA